MPAQAPSPQATSDPRERRRQAEQIFEAYRYAHGKHDWAESARLRKLLPPLGFTVSLAPPPRLVELPGRVGSTFSARTLAEPSALPIQAARAMMAPPKEKARTVPPVRALDLAGSDAGVEPTDALSSLPDAEDRTRVRTD